MGINILNGDIQMKYLPDDLRREYEYLTKIYPDIPEIRHPLINLSDTFKAYFILADYFTDESSGEEGERMLVGVRSVDLLASALGRQVVSFGNELKYTQPLDICATLFYGIVKNHSFADGNKRTALLILLYQLQLYKYYPIVPKEEFEELVVSVAENSIDTKYRGVFEQYCKAGDPIIQTISKLLSKMTERKDHSYHVAPTMREFCSALENHGVVCKVSGTKVHFSYLPSDVWKIFTSEEKNYVIPFSGWTRVVGAGTARDVLNNLGLFSQFASYKNLLNGTDSFYQLIDDFKEPLRRLKDE